MRPRRQHVGQLVEHQRGLVREHPCAIGPKPKARTERSPSASLLSSTAHRGRSVAAVDSVRNRLIFAIHGSEEARVTLADFKARG